MKNWPHQVLGDREGKVTSDRRSGGPGGEIGLDLGEEGRGGVKE